ncbi:MAG: oligosaccharide flippase family protein [Lentisphaeraceae bacterium]|nr:oligosaccharide flippase family protein [Lentisphaeraceae bacterium]
MRKILILKWDKENSTSNSKLIASIFITKVLLGLLCLSIALLVDLIINKDSFAPEAITLCFLAIFSDELAQVFRAPDHANQKYGFEIVIPLFSKIFCFTSIWFLQDNLKTIENALFLYATWGAAASLLSFFSYLIYKPKFSPKHALTNIKAYLREGYAFSLTGFFVMISFYIDSVILGTYSLEETGIYNCAFRIIIVFGVLSGGFSHVLFAKFATSKGNLDSSGQTLQAVSPLIVTLFSCIMIGVIALSDQAISTVYSSSFSEASNILLILAPFILFSALSNVFAHTLEAFGLQKKVMRFNIISCIFNLVTNLIFIPIWGMYAAAVTTVLTELLNLLLSYSLLKRSGLNPFSQFPTSCLKLILLTATVGIVAHFLALIPGIILGASVFIPLFIKAFKKANHLQGEIKCVS